MQRVVILGGSGFIGRWLTQALLARGYEVVIVDPNHPADKRARWVEADARMRVTLEEIVTRDDMVVHLVHTTIPVESMTNLDQEHRDNVNPFKRLVNWFRECPPELFLYSSSGGQVYGNVKSLPIGEKTPRRPVSNYGRSKMLMENHLISKGWSGKLPYLILRIANPYGPFQELSNRHGVIPRLFQSVIHHTPVTLYGAQDTVRDYIYIEDVAEAIVRLIERLAVHQAVNIGTGVGTTLPELAALVEKVSGGKVNAVLAPRRPTDVKANVLSVTRLRKLTGFTPAVSLEDGLARTWEHMKNHEKA